MTGDEELRVPAQKAIDSEGFTEEFVRTEPRSQLREKLLTMTAKAMPASDIEAVGAYVAPVVLEAGSVVIQRGTRHRWRPIGDQPARMAAVSGQ